MDQSLINWAFALVSASLGWFARELWSAVKELKSDLAKLREELPTHYVRKDDFVEFKRDLMNVLERIEHKLDTKADK